mgnify:CR=1 FL=1|jgi:hypothetical protein
MDLFGYDEALVALRNELFPESIRTMLATNIYAACAMSRNIKDSLINMPKRASWIAGHSFAYYIDKLVTAQIDKSVVGKFPYSYQEIRIPKCGYPYMEYYSDYCKFHIKKAEKAERLPKAAIQRVSNSLSNEMFLDFGPEYIPVEENKPFALITYGHKGFDLTFIELGFPKWDYSDWVGNWDIAKNISKDVAEDILKNKEPELREEFNEKIVKGFELKLKGE